MIWHGFDERAQTAEEAQRRGWPDVAALFARRNRTALVSGVR